MLGSERTKELIRQPLNIRETLSLTLKGICVPETLYDVTGLGDRYRLDRAERSDCWIGIEPAVKLSFRLLDEHKRVLDTPYSCRICAVSADFSFARIRTKAEIPILSNILIEAGGEVYAKVTGKEDGMLTICFTRTPEQPGWKEALTKGPE